MNAEDFIKEYLKSAKSKPKLKGKSMAFVPLSAPGVYSYTHTPENDATAVKPYSVNLAANSNSGNVLTWTTSYGVDLVKPPVPSAPSAPSAPSSGCVDWPAPVDPLHDTGEGGLWAYVFFLHEDPDQDTDAPPFNECYDPASTITLTHPDVIVSDPAEVYPDEDSLAYPELPLLTDGMYQASDLLSYGTQMDKYLSHAYDSARSVLAAVCLGSTPYALQNTQTGHIFSVTRADLSPEGQRLVSALEDLYKRPPRFVTFLDT